MTLSKEDRNDVRQVVRWEISMDRYEYQTRHLRPHQPQPVTSQSTVDACVAIMVTGIISVTCVIAGFIVGKVL
jgi:hypothetical protein